MSKTSTLSKNARVATNRGTFNPALNEFIVPISSLKFDPKNPRTHSARNITAVKESLAKWGQQLPIIVKDKIVIAGNGRLQAAKDLGWTHIAAMPFNHEARKDVRGFALADNRSAELADWNPEMLGAEMRDLQADGMDLTTLGWEEYEFEPLLSAEWVPPAVDHVEFDANGAGKKAISFTAAQFKFVEVAIARVRKTPKQKELTDPEAIVIICKAYGC